MWTCLGAGQFNQIDPGSPAPRISPRSIQWRFPKRATRWDKFRPIIMFGAVPLLFMSFLTFRVPSSFEAGMKIIYALPHRRAWDSSTHWSTSGTARWPPRSPSRSMSEPSWWRLVPSGAGIGGVVLTFIVGAFINDLPGSRRSEDVYSGPASTADLNSQLVRGHLDDEVRERRLHDCQPNGRRPCGLFVFSSMDNAHHQLGRDITPFDWPSRHITARRRAAHPHGQSGAATRQRRAARHRSD